MNDCCASSSPRNKAPGSTCATLPSHTVRPGVTFPDWSVVTSPTVQEALQAMVRTDHVFDRWSGYDPATDRVRVALLQLYAENGRAPTPSALAERARLSETAIRPLLEELRRRYLSKPLLTAVLLVLFAGVALVVTLTGLAGVMATSVSA